MKITITVNDNGAAVHIPVGACNDYEHNLVYEFDSDDHTNIKGYVNMLYDITDAIMLFGKYSQQRIDINTIHGEKYECDGCEICNK